MGGLKDQLLKAGLVNEKQVKKAQKEVRQQAKAGNGQLAKESQEERNRIQEAANLKAEHDRKLNLMKKQEAEQKALIAQVRQLIEVNRLVHEEGDIPYNFADEGKIKKLNVTEATRRQIAKGVLAIVKLDGKYELVPSEAAEKIQQRAPVAVIVFNQQSIKTDAQEEVDPYAGYDIPDDLIW